jgi:hypothetical protein
LDAAQKIVAELHGMNEADQLLAIQFATQTLRLTELTTTATQPSGNPANPPPTSPIPVLGRSTDIKSFTAAKSPKSDQQFTAVVAYYYQFEAPSEARKGVIDVETMKDAARQAGRAQVRNWIFTLSNAKNAGYLDPAGRGKFKLNAVGENLVAITLPGNGASGPITGGLGKKKANKNVTSKKSPAKSR